MRGVVPASSPVEFWASRLLLAHVPSSSHWTWPWGQLMKGSISWMGSSFSRPLLVVEDWANSQQELHLIFSKSAFFWHDGHCCSITAVLTLFIFVHINSGWSTLQEYVLSSDIKDALRLPPWYPQDQNLERQESWEWVSYQTSTKHRPLVQSFHLRTFCESKVIKKYVGFCQMLLKKPHKIWDHLCFLCKEDLSSLPSFYSTPCPAPFLLCNPTNSSKL